jgi:c-di-GMP-related signal transduction protein
MAEVFIGRQPVLDVQQHVLGYELLFRSSTENRANFSDASAATFQVIFERACGDRPAAGHRYRKRPG